MTKPSIIEEDESSPVKTKTKFYRKLLNFYDKVKSPKKRTKSVSSPSKSIKVRRQFYRINQLIL